ncbi:curli production assembly/transport protein CsgE [Vibrio scophthalmi]|uniref:curli production assembly/transport protein CsgE n=1 Tax=Vibrio scophthalmi TaxID=45658 RepID=UPI002FF10C88
MTLTNTLKVIFLGFLLMMFSVLSVAQKAEVSDEVSDDGHLENNEFYIEVEGLIVDRTMTRLGDDFYFFFTQYMNDRHGSLQENLVVKERPTALSGSIISVVHRDKVIYRTALSPGRKTAQDKAKDALSAVTNYLLRWKAQREYQDTFDLERDEF